MKKLLSVLAIISCASSSPAAIVFQDGFNRADSSALGSPSIGNAWSESVSAGDGDARIVTNSLELTNDGSATANVNGRVWAYTSLLGLSGYNTQLNQNSDTVVWSFNMRQIRGAPSGFDSGNYGAALVLAASDGDFMQGNGYAVVLGNGGEPDPLRLARFSNGLDGNANLVNIISSGDYGAEYLNIKVEYNPVGDNWSLFATSGTAFSDPSLVTTQLGSTTADSTYTGTALSNMGAFWSYSTGANQPSTFDNITLAVIPEPATAGLVLLVGGALWMRRRASKR